MRLTLSIASNDNSNNEVSTKSFGNITQAYVGLSGTRTASTALPYRGTTQYQSFAEWTSAVARGLISLSNNTYTNSLVNATFDVGEEVNN